MRASALAFLLIPVQVAGESLPMLPMTQTYHSVAGQTLQAEFWVADEAVDIFISNTSSDGFSISLPNGMPLTGESAVANGFTWASQNDPVSGALLVHLFSKSAAKGVYRFSLKGAYQSTLTVVENQSLEYSAFIGSSENSNAPSEPLAIVLALEDSGVAAKAARVVFSANSVAGSTRVSTILADDGVPPDIRPGDGAYTGSLTLDETGIYEAIFAIDWRGHKGRMTERFEVNYPDVSLSGGFSVSGLDENHNGKIEKVKIVFAETAPRLVGEYSITAEIKDAEGWSVAETTLIRSPEANLAVEIPVEKLDELGSKPWFIASLNVWRGAKPLGIWKDFGVVDIEKSLFERKMVSIVGIGESGPHDPDVKPIESFYLDAVFDVQERGIFNISAEVRTRSGKLIERVFGAEIAMDPGQRSFRFSVAGSKIAAVGEDGPYRLTNLSMYPLGLPIERVRENAQFRELVGETGFYQCAEFAGYPHAPQRRK